MNIITRESLLTQIAQIQLMEPGKLCIIRQGPDGPYYNLQCREEGKTVTRYVPQEQLESAQTHTANFQQFQTLVDQYVQVVATQSRAIREGQSLKKNETAFVALAQNEEINQLISQFAARTPSGLATQELEFLLRAAIFKPANALVGLLLQQVADRVDAAYQPKLGEVRKAREPIGVQCIFGVFELNRDYYYHAGKKEGHYPADAALGLEVGYTPALARLMCLEGADETSFEKSEIHMLETGGIPVSGRQIQRVVQRIGQDAQQWQEREVQPSACVAERVPIMYVSGDGTGVPMRKDELKGRAGKQTDGSAKTRQAYLGCVFTQHRTDEKGHPVRDWESTTYVSSMAGIEDFGPCLRREALRRGLGGAQKIVLLIDGANGLENMGHLCFNGCTQIVDFYHAFDHGGDVLEALLGSKQHLQYKSRLHQWVKRLLKNQVEQLIAETRSEAIQLGKSTAVEEQLGYFVHNVARMQYGTFRSQGFFIGSGVIEAGCKTVIGSRCKQSGMFWSLPGAENILAFRCIHASRRISQFWNDRLNAHAARNDLLPLAA